MFEIILSLIFLIIWLRIQCYIIKVTMTKVSDSTIRYDIITFIFALETAAFMCGLFLGLC